MVKLTREYYHHDLIEECLEDSYKLSLYIEQLSCRTTCTLDASLIFECCSGVSYAANVTSVDISSKSLEHAAKGDLSEFKNLQSVNAAENRLVSNMFESVGSSVNMIQLIL